MNFYEYYEGNSEAIPDMCLMAAKYLIELNFKVIPCKNKMPIERIKSVNRIRLKPIHLLNCDFYFRDADEIALLTGDGIEVIDIDCKYDLTGKLYKQLATAIRYTLPDVFDKLVIQRTKGGGYHLIYKCAQIGGNQKLANRNATGDEMGTGERKKVLVETRGNGGYIVISPSPGYSFIKGTPEDIAEITPEQRAELLAICKSFNQIMERDLPGISPSKQADPQTPWNKFNEKHGWEFIRDEITKAGWETLREDDDRIFVLRPGAMSKTSGAIWKGTNILYLFSTSTEFPEQKPISPFDVVRYLKYDGDVIKAAKALADEGYGEYLKDEGEFYKKTDSGAIVHSLRAIATWMHDIGIRKYFVNDKDFELVQVTDNKVRVVDNNHLKKIFTDYINRTCPPEIDEYFLRKFSNIFSKENLVNVLERLDDNFIKSDPSAAWLFYRNYAIKVTSENVVSYEYNSLPGYIWNKSIIDRDFSTADSNCEARQFIINVSGAATKPFESAIGYLLHPYKDAANPKCVILYDEYYDESQEEREPEGGTGKGMFIKIIKEFRNTVIIDGKAWKNDRQFAYQQVGPDSEIVAFEDVRRNFDFENLFSVITEDWTIEKKNLGAFSIPFDRSPKVIITSNYPLKGNSRSHLRRRFELEVLGYYNLERTILSEFGHRFFVQWSIEEWNRFDNYVIECVQSYLRDNLIEAANMNLERSRLIAETNKDFMNWIERQVLEKLVMKDEFMDKFTNEFPDYRAGRKAITQALFTRWLVKYCKYKAIKLDARNLYNGKMCYRFGISEQAELPPSGGDELPF